MYKPRVKIIPTSECETIKEVEDLFNKELGKLSGSLAGEGEIKYYYQIQQINKVSIGGEEAFLIIYEE